MIVFVCDLNRLHLGSVTFEIVKNKNFNFKAKIVRERERLKKQYWHKKSAIIFYYNCFNIYK